MKNKKMTYVLLATVVVVWGLIFYRLFTGVENSTPVNASVDTQVVQNDVKVEIDSFNLILDYRDPFKVIKNIKPITQVKPQRVVKKVEVKEEEKEKVLPVDWSFIAYRGIFKNEKKMKKTGLVTINNHDYVVAEGDSVAQISVKKLFKDSIGVFYKGSFSYIKKY